MRSAAARATRTGARPSGNGAGAGGPATSGRGGSSQGGSRYQHSDVDGPSSNSSSRRVPASSSSSSLPSSASSSSRGGSGSGYPSSSSASAASASSSGRGGAYSGSNSTSGSSRSGGNSAAYSSSSASSASSSRQSSGGSSRQSSAPAPAPPQRKRLELLPRGGSSAAGSAAAPANAAAARTPLADGKSATSEETNGTLDGASPTVAAAAAAATAASAALASVASESELDSKEFDGDMDGKQAYDDEEDRDDVEGDEVGEDEENFDDEVGGDDEEEEEQEDSDYVHVAHESEHGAHGADRGEAIARGFDVSQSAEEFADEVLELAPEGMQASIAEVLLLLPTSTRTKPPSVTSALVCLWKKSDRVDTLMVARALDSFMVMVDEQDLLSEYPLFYTAIGEVVGNFVCATMSDARPFGLKQMLDASEDFTRTLLGRNRLQFYTALFGALREYPTFVSQLFAEVTDGVDAASFFESPQHAEQFLSAVPAASNAAVNSAVAPESQ